MNRLDLVRDKYGSTITELASLKTRALSRAFASVPREKFVGPGPWQVIDPEDLARGYESTVDSDPAHLYENVLVALDASRNLNNGEPASLGRWLDALRLKKGFRFLHVGCGVGYYTAIAAEVVGPTGGIVGVEVEPALAERARTALHDWPAADVVSGSFDLEASAVTQFDAILINAGATTILAEWLDALSPTGRLLVPLTVGAPRQEIGVGHMLRIQRSEECYSAGFVSPVGIFHCAGARDGESESLLRAAYSGGGEGQVRSLRRDVHRKGLDCWLHSRAYCLSRSEW